MEILGGIIFVAVLGFVVYKIKTKKKSTGGTGPREPGAGDNRLEP